MQTQSTRNIAIKAPLELDPKHPGINDPAYLRRRHDLYDLAFDHRVNGKGWPKVVYTAEEHALWRFISERLVQAHAASACAAYRRGKERLKIQTQSMPQLGDIDQALRAHHDFGLVPAEGLLDVRTFYEYLQRRQMPCTQFLRHPTCPQFTPEPDVVHDLIGHVPCLMDSQYTEITQKIGEGVLQADAAGIEAWSRVYWFTVEFGLIEERGQTKVLGAGLLSSLDEITYCFSDHVVRRPFDLDAVISTSYDPSRKQNVLFVLSSLTQLHDEVARLQARLAP